MQIVPDPVPLWSYKMQQTPAHDISTAEERGRAVVTRTGVGAKRTGASERTAGPVHLAPAIDGVIGNVHMDLLAFPAPRTQVSNCRVRFRTVAGNLRLRGDENAPHIVSLLRRLLDRAGEG